jgi:transglycosylase-like protein with SLT domain
VSEPLRVRVTFRKSVSDGNYGSELAEASLEYDVDPNEEQTDYAEALLMDARMRVHAELGRSPSEAVRRAVKAQQRPAPVLPPEPDAVFGMIVGLAGLGPASAAEEEDQEAATVSPYSARADCIVTYESHWNADAVNPRSGASGLGQFLLSTWRTTPYADRSRFDPWASHAAVCWMLSVGRAREFEVVTRGLC